MHGCARARSLGPHRLAVVSLRVRVREKKRQPCRNGEDPACWELRLQYTFFGDARADAVAASKRHAKVDAYYATALRGGDFRGVRLRADARWLEDPSVVSVSAP